jgi:hypothetical protein
VEIRHLERELRRGGRSLCWIGQKIGDRAIFRFGMAHVLL